MTLEDIRQIELRWADYASTNYQMNRAVADIQDLIKEIRRYEERRNDNSKMAGD